MRDSIARLFRSINSRIITTRSSIFQKVLKTSLRMTSAIGRRWNSNGIAEVAIDNFDSDLKMIVNLSFTMGRSIYWTGFHEVKELIYLHRFLKPDMVFFDIGANQGEYSLFAAKRLPSGKVFSFEPLPAIREVFNGNVQLNGFENITLLPYGLSSSPGELMIYEFAGENEGLATLYSGGREVKSAQPVELKVLDEEFSKFGIDRLDFIKIDIEGAELYALNGAAQTIQKFRPTVLVEINETSYVSAGYSSRDVLSFFTSKNYKPYKLNKAAEPDICETMPTFGNILFMPS